MVGQNVLPRMRAFVAELAKAHGERLKRYLAGAGFRDAEDIAQETFERLLKRKDDPALIRHPAAYLNFVAAQVARERYLRAAKNRDAGENAAGEPAPDLDASWSGSDPAKCDALEREACSALARLDTAHRHMLWLKERYGYSYAEIAKRLHVSRFKVKRYLNEANAKLDTLYPARRSPSPLRRNPKEE